MTSKTTTFTKGAGKLERFPDYAPREDMQNWLYLYDSGVLTSLTLHFANVPSVTVASEVPVGPSLPVRDDARIPDLLVVRDGYRELIEEQRGYAIDRQGKAPGFALEVASPTTGKVDYTDKRVDYELYGVAEYWRFDPSGGDYHDAALAGDRLVDRVYEPIAVEMLEDGAHRGYSDALGLYVCWDDGRLRFFDPQNESYLRTHDEERAERMAAESRVAELEAELRRLRGEWELPISDDSSCGCDVPLSGAPSCKSPEKPMQGKYMFYCRRFLDYNSPGPVVAILNRQSFARLPVRSSLSPHRC